MDKSKETVPVEAEFVRFSNELENKPKGMSMTELGVTPPHGGEFEIPQGPAFINGRWEL